MHEHGRARCKRDVSRLVTDAVMDWPTIYADPTLNYQYDYDLSSTTFNPDGSLTFMAAMEGPVSALHLSGGSIKVPCRRWVRRRMSLRERVFFKRSVITSFPDILRLLQMGLFTQQRRRAASTITVSFFV